MGRIDWSRIEQAYLDGSETLEQVARRFGVSERAVKGKASQEGWVARRKALRRESRAERIIYFPATPGPTSRDPDELAILDRAICNLDALLSKPSVDGRTVGPIASALVKLLEYRRKLQPPTAADLAEQLLALQISPAELVSELKKRWTA